MLQDRYVVCPAFLGISKWYLSVYLNPNERTPNIPTFLTNAFSQATVKQTLQFFSSWFQLHSQVWKYYTEEQLPKSPTKKLTTERKG